MIGHGLFHALDAQVKAYHPGFDVIPAEHLHEHFDMIFVPASNFVSPSVDLSPQASYFSRSRLPIYCFGLGSQMLPGQDRTLRPGTDRFLRLVSERSGSISVRGTYTAEVLWDLGIRNVSVTGCPSLLAINAPALERLATTRPSLDRVLLGFSNNVRRHSLAPEAMRASENSLFERMLRENAFYVLQNEMAEFEMLTARKAGDEEALRSTTTRVARAFDVPADRADVRDFLASRLRAFFDVDNWLGCARTMGSAVGSRFHGNIAALLTGTPALFLAHDMRTVELCDLLRVPSLFLDRAYSGDEIIERLLAADYQPFVAQVPRLMVEWRLFLARNGLAAPMDAVKGPANAGVAPELIA